MRKVVCEYCGAEHEKTVSEYNRKMKLGTPFYCNNVCSSKTPKNLAHINRVKSDYDITQHSGNRRDEFSHVKEHLRRAQRRKKWKCDLTLDHLKELWDNQQGKCALTTLPIKITPVTTAGHCDLRTEASLDRIDSNVGYLIGNVQWVSASINLAKRDMTNEMILEWIDSIRRT